MGAPGPLGAQAYALPGDGTSTHKLRWVDAPAAAAAIWKALQASGPLFGPLVRQETGEALDEILNGLIPALLMSIGVVAATSLIGSAAGAAIGALAGGVGAAPGAVIGGELGYDLGVAVLSFLGLGFLIAAIGAGLIDLKVIVERAARRAVNSLYVGSGQRDAEIALAAHDFAQAEATLVKLILMGLVALLLRRPTAGAVKSLAGSVRTTTSALRGGEAVAVAEANVAGLVANLRASRFGEGFAAWVERSWRRLIENPRLRAKVPEPSIESNVSTATTPSQLARAANPGQDGSALTKAGAASGGMRVLETRPADVVNADMVAAGQKPAWMMGTDVQTQVVPAGQRYQMVVSEGQAQAMMDGKAAFGGWASPDPVPSQLYARDQMSILTQFKSDVSYVATVETTAPQTLNSGIAGGLEGTSGGASQVQFLATSGLKLVGQPQPLPPE